MTPLETEQIEKLAYFIKASNNTVFFGGAGISTESGIPDFRSEHGLYRAKQVYGHSPEELLSYTFFKHEPERFFHYYRENLIARDAKPNSAHIILAKLEQAGKLQTVITQNIDGLHQAAGSQKVLELHGSNWRQYCIKCGEKYSLDYILRQENIPTCVKCGGIVRPDVVLYQEGLDDVVMEAAIQAITQAKLLIVSGTSLAVYPAAGLLRWFSGDTLVLINKSPTPADSTASLVIRDSIGKVLRAVYQHFDCHC
ncbi:MAG: NAD-dependent protein deacylase [Clostridiales bacterium]|nr:NAD-dependent protein deacylase [Clostridiales bacterium]